MSTQILISADEFEHRVAIVENQRLVDLEVERERKVIGNIYLGRVVNVLPGMDAAFVDIGLPRNAFIYVTDVLPSGHASGAADVHFESIGDAVSPGQRLMVQIARPPVGAKGARVTSRISLPGRYAVLLTYASGHCGVSRRIADENERRRLRRLAERVKPLDYGLILRTEAEGCTEADLRNDVDHLVAEWREIEERASQGAPPLLLHQESGLVTRIVRDVFAEECESLIVDDEAVHAQVLNLVSDTRPDLRSRVKLYQDPEPLFERWGVEPEIRTATQRTVPLEHGGSITIDVTEALTAIDVNTGRYVGGANLRETIFRTNMAAVHEVCRQLRLRDIGGIIVIDFIDMDRVRDRIRVMDALEDELKRDRMRTRIVHLSPLGLVEMTRRRRGRSLLEIINQRCDFCHGTGEVPTPLSVAIDAARRLRSEYRGSDGLAITITATPQVAALLVGPDDSRMQRLERATGAEITILVDPDRDFREVEIESYAETPVLPAPEVGEVAAIESDEHVLTDEDAAYTVLGGRLAVLPSDVGQRPQPTMLRVTQVNRWLIQTEWARNA